MGKPNFFADTDVLNCLLGMQYDPKVSPVMDLTVDVPDLPIWFSLKSNAQEHTLTLYTQTELYMKNEGMASAMGHVIVNGQTGQVKMSVPQGIDQKNVAIFYMACRNLSIFAKEKGLATLWADDDPEQCGILLEQKNGSLTWRKVSGMDRPELLVQQLFGGTIKMRPYMEDFWDRSETDMMSLEEKIEKAEGGDKFAMAKLAQAYLDGDDEVEQDPVKAAYWFRKEAELKDSEGAFNLGLLYAKGFGVERDFEKAAEWMEKAVTWGDPDGKAPAALYRSMAENQKKAEAGGDFASVSAEERYQLDELFSAVGKLNLKKKLPWKHIVAVFTVLAAIAAGLILYFRPVDTSPVLTMELFPAEEATEEMRKPCLKSPPIKDTRWRTDPWAICMNRARSWSRTSTRSCSILREPARPGPTTRSFCAMLAINIPI